MTATLPTRASSTFLELPIGHPALTATPEQLARALELLALVGDHTTVDEVRASLELREAVRLRALSEKQMEVSIHEASHAVMALSLGVRVLSATIQESTAAKVAGRCVLGWGDDADRHLFIWTPLDRLQVERELLLQLAAPIGQELAGVPMDPEHAREHDDQATGPLFYMRPPLSDAETRAFLTWIRARARDQMRRLYPAMVELALALRQRLTMNETEIRACVELYMPEPLRPLPSSLPSLGATDAAHD